MIDNPVQQDLFWTIYHKYSPFLNAHARKKMYRFLHLAEDVLQEVFSKYLLTRKNFNSKEHEKAWLIKVATNISRNMVMLRLKRSTANLEDVTEIGVKDEDSEVFEAIMNLPVKHKIVMVLFYVEGYKTEEIADITQISSDAVRKRLQKGRELLKIEFERCNYFNE